MKIKIFFLTVLFFIFPLNIYAREPADFLIRNYSVDLKVYDISAAFERLESLPGINMQRFSDIISGTGHINYRVPVGEVSAFFNLLEEAGDIVRSNTWANNVFTQVVNLETQLSVREAEYTRMQELLLEVESIDDFYFVEQRLSNVIWNMNQIVGQLGIYELDTATARINVFIYTEDTLPIIEPVTGLARVGFAFTTSAGATLSFIQNIILLFAYASIPLSILIIVGFIIKRLIGRRFVFVRAKKEEVSDENKG